ncbi:Bifunctional hemolysin/adenylate cyclase [compost metagenome]
MAIELSIDDGFFYEYFVDLILPDVGGVDLVRSGLDNYTLGDFLENLELIGVENINGAGNSLDNRITGNSGANLLLGHGGNDILDGQGGADNMQGGTGNDTYYVDNASDLVVEALNSGIDLVRSSLSTYTLGANVENGEILSAGVANLVGNSLDNLIYAGAGNNSINGGAGVDTVSYANGGGVSVDLGITTAQSTGGSGLDTLINIENLQGSSSNDTLVGSAASNVLDGGAGRDIVRGGDGNDVVLAEGGYSAEVTWSSAGHSVDEFGNPTGFDTWYYVGETLDGGAGVDSVSYANALSGAVVNLSTGFGYSVGAIPVLDAQVGFLVDSLGNFISSVDEAIFDFADHLVGFENIVGSRFSDQLTGNAAANSLNGGAGADTLVGGNGSDIYYVDNVGDVVSETNATASTGGTDTVYSYLAAYALGANIEQGRILATGAANLTGNGLANLLYAGAGNNVLNGGAGIDTASYAYAASAVTANLGVTTAQATGGSGTDTLVAIENLIGSTYNDRLTGNAAANSLNGGVGNDLLVGGLGRDILTGGAGNDIFDFNALGETGLTSATWDVITDFTRGADKIDLSTLDANTATAANDAFTAFIGSAVAFSQAGQLKFANGVVYGNTDTDSAAEFAIQLTGISTLSMADLIA